MMLLVSSVHAVELKVVTEDFPPFNYKERDKITGMSTEVVQEVLKEVGIKTKIEVYPWVRSYKMALNNKNILIYSIARTKHREKLFKWIGNISPYNVYIYKLKSRDDIKFDSLESAKKYIFGGVKEDVKQQHFSK